MDIPKTTSNEHPDPEPEDENPITKAYKPYSKKKHRKYKKSQKEHKIEY